MSELIISIPASHPKFPTILALLAASGEAAPAKVVAAAAPAPEAEEAPAKPTKVAKEEKPVKPAKPTKEAPPADDGDADLLGGDDAAPVITLKELREAGMKVIKGGKSAELKSILEKYEVDSLSALPEDKFGEVHAKIVKIKV